MHTLLSFSHLEKLQENQKNCDEMRCIHVWVLLYMGKSISLVATAVLQFLGKNEIRSFLPSEGSLPEGKRKRIGRC